MAAALHSCDRVNFPSLSTLVGQKLDRRRLASTRETPMLRKPIAFAGICCIACILLAGCGGSESRDRTATSHARQTPLASNADVGSARQQSRHPAAALGQLPPQRSPSTVRRDNSPVRRDNSRVTRSKVARARLTPAASDDEHSTTGAKPLNPCRLVSLSEAQAITGGAITKATEAPLGPTCIYSGKGTRDGVTLTLDTESFNQVARHMTARKHVVISGHRSLCGRLGTQTLFVPLARRHLLNVTAPCGIAQRFAVVAVGRLAE
jgi:hypothetical protein